MSSLSAKLREIIGQETQPPLWIYVSKSQIPDLEAAAQRIDELEIAVKEARMRLAKFRALWNGPCHECDYVLRQVLGAKD